MVGGDDSVMTTTVHGDKCLEVTTIHGVDEYDGVRSFSCDNNGTAHIYDSSGPIAMYGAESAWCIRVVLSDGPA